MIREIDETDLGATPPGVVRNAWWLWFFAALAIGATLLASWQGKALGWPAFILLAGISVVSMLSILTIFFNRQAVSGDEEFNADGKSLLASFNAQTMPSLIVIGAKPTIANAAYLDLARELGVDATPETPPSVERLFAKQEKAASAAIYRLHHTNNANNIGEEIIRTLGADGEYRSFKVKVTAIDNGQLWQIHNENEGVGEGGGSDTSILAQAPIGLFCVSVDGAVLKTNEVLQGWVGFDGETAPMHMKEFIENPGALLDSPPTPGRTVRSDTRLLTQKGVVSPVVLMGSWHQMDSGDVYASVAVYGHSGLGSVSGSTIDADDNVLEAAREDQENTKEVSRHTDELPQDGIKNAPFGVVMLDSTDLNTAKILHANDAMRSMLEQNIESETRFKSLFLDNEASQTFIANGINIRGGPVDVRLTGKQTRPVDVYFATPNEDGCAVYIIDVTSRKLLEDKLGQSQKMQAIGQLAGGVAHDFNNLLTAIRLNTDELLGRHPIGDPSYPELQKINQTVARATGLVRKLLAFSRKQTLRTVVLDVTNTLSDITHLLQDVLVERVKLKVVHGRGLMPIQADKGQLETVLMNLCVNARDAMLEKSGGTITLQSSKTTDQELLEQGIALRNQGGYVRFDVTDTGTGMDKETQDKIFEPFFTTKAQGKGTGLGLATVYGIVQQSGGHLRVNSKLGVGTTFSVYIPTATGDVTVSKPDKPQIVAARLKPSDLAGHGNILFVEDEAAVRVIAAKTLRKRGYTVVEAGDGVEAYDILESGEHSFDLMISDVVMPGMDGPTLLKKGRDLLDSAAIVFISGYAEEEFSELLAEEPDVTFLPKPFTLIQLAEKVKTVLAATE